MPNYVGHNRPCRDARSCAVYVRKLACLGRRVNDFSSAVSGFLRGHMSCVCRVGIQN